MLRKLSLQSRLTACFLAFSVLPLVLFFLLFFPYLNSSMLSARMSALEGLAAANVSDLELMGDSLLREGERLAMDQRVLSSLGVLPDKAEGNPSAAADGYLAAMVDDTCLGAALLTREGEVRASSHQDTYKQESLLSMPVVSVALSGNRAVSGLLPSLSTPGSQAIYFAVPISYEGRMSGVLVRELSPTVLDRKTASFRQGETGRMMLVDQSGTILSHTNGALKGKSLESGELMGLYGSYVPGQSERSGSGSMVMEGVQQGYGYCILSNMPWMLVTYQAQSELRSQDVLVILYAVLSLLGLGLLSFLIGRITSRSMLFPIRQLNAAFRQTGHNQFTPVTPYGASEFTDLAQGYNSMIALLESNVNRLSDSNRQLAATIAQLEIERDRMQFLKDVPADIAEKRVTAEFNLLSGELVADDGFFALFQMEPQVSLSLSHFFSQYVLPEDAERLYALIDQQADQIHEELRIKTAQGMLWIQAHARVYYNPQGDPVKVSATLLNDTAAHDVNGDDEHPDATTGLITKSAFLNRLRERLSEEAGLKEGGTVICLQLTNLPLRSEDHILRALALRMTADRLRSFAAPNGLAARMGDTKFLLHLPACQTKEITESRLSELQQVLSAPIPWKKAALSLTVLLGAALYLQNGMTAELLFGKAQTALSAADGLSGAAWTLYEEGGQERPADTARVTLERTMRAKKIVETLGGALESETLTLEYQPILRLDNNGIAGFESTLRMISPDLGVISAGELIPLAEQNGLMPAVGSFVLKKACRFVRELRERQGKDYFVSVNVSGLQLEEKDFVDTVYLALKEAGLPGQALQLEFSERFMSAFNTHLAKVKTLRRLGVRIALDDYGAGTAALSQMYNMPLDVLKIDKSFLTGAAASQGKEFILQTMVDLAHSLNLQVIAVGVEHHKRLNTLVKLGYDMAQGYHFCPPLPLSALEVYLDTRSEENGEAQR